MAEIPVSLSDRKLEPHVPEANTTAKGEKAFRLLKKVTHNGSKIARKGERSDRSIDLRGRRAEIYKRVMETDDPEERRRLFAEGHARDEIESQYLSQGDISVDLPGLGEQKSHYTMIEPPEGRKLPGEQEPIFLIPGISNDIDSVGSLAKELAFQGKNVIVVGMPDSQMGEATEEFAKAVEDSATLEPHSNFYKAAINRLIGDGNFELWGMSAGAMITAEILNDSDFQGEVKKAVLVSPAGTSEQSQTRQNLGVVSEALRVYGKPGKGVHYTLAMNRTADQVQKTEDQKKIAGRIFNGVRKHTLKDFPLYQTMRVADGGQITVVSGTKDNMTRSRESDESFKSHPQVELISIPGGVHNTPIIDAPAIVPEILETQKLSEVRAELGQE